ncbi:MAG TPA: JAB domain-containing protein [Actinomycetota bacterium]|nr:JAB domain-containing protein [Actinomycetota bacterium]
MATAQTRLVEYILPNLAQIVSEIDGEVLFQISLDADGEVIDIECLASSTQPKNMLPLDLLLERPREVDAAAVAYVSSGTGPFDGPDEFELAFTARLIEAGAAAGIPVADHHLVTKGHQVSLRETTALWA